MEARRSVVRDRSLVRSYHRLLAVLGAIVLSIALALPAHAAAGDLDPTFGVGGKVTTNFTRDADVGYQMALQADGKIVIAGASGFLGSNPKFALARYNTDGSLDTSFGGDGRVTTDFTPGEDLAYGLGVQADGKIVAAGQSGGRNPKFALARYNTDGSLDTSFSGNGKLTTDLTPKADFAYGMVIQSDGQIVAAGDSGVGGAGSNPKFALVRYNTDGSLDTSFSGNGKLRTDFTAGPDDLLAVALQSDGKIVAAGGAGFGSPNEKFALARYQTDGSLDTSFSGNGKLTTDFSPRADVVFALTVQADGKIVAAGGARLGASNPKWALARYDTDGSLDTSFGGDGKVTTDFTRGDDDAYSVALQADGKIVAAGQSGGRNPKFALARYNTDGSLDTSFSGNGKLTTDFTPEYDSAYTVVIQADGKIVTDGTAGFAKFALARYLAS